MCHACCSRQQQEMTTKLKAYEEQVEHLSAAVQRKGEEVQQLSTQLEHVHAEMKERLFEASREAARIEQQFQQQILGINYIILTTIL